VCVCVCVCTLKVVQLELSTLSSVHIHSLAGPLNDLTLTLKVKGQGRRIMKCAASVGMHVVMTA